MSTKTLAETNIDQAADRLTDLSHRIHAHPELGFEEYQASAWVADELERGGFQVHRGVADLETALVAIAGSGELVVGICCEYDALPGIGHACGHNIIGAAGVGAGLALVPLADELGITVKVFGCPAEENGGGKAIMLHRGVFEGTHAAMMIHPVPSPIERVDANMMASINLAVTYIGVPAQAAEWPDKGVNAADAMTVAQVAIGLMRQQLPASDRLHGIVTHGGDAQNIIPARTTAIYGLRSETMQGLRKLQPRVEACFQAGATASGAAVEIKQDRPPYTEFHTDEDIAGYFVRNAEALGRQQSKEPAPRASTDMANVSLAIPSIHAQLAIDSNGAVNHTPEFAQYCGTASADAAVVHGAKAMAWTCIDLAGSDAQRQRLTRR